MSIAFDGVTSESQFIHNYLVSFMKGISQTVAMMDCNRATKNMRSQLVLGSTVVTGGDVFFLCGYTHVDGSSEGIVLC